MATENRHSACFSGKSGSRRAFSLSELLVVIGVVSLVLILALPLVGNYREKSVQVACVNNLRQIGAATVQYIGEHRNQLPYYRVHEQEGKAVHSGSVSGTWYYNLAPYIGVPRTEVPETIISSSERTVLGAPGNRIDRPCVFTCPGHSKKESNTYWKPTPMTWPADRPVSYAPNLKISQDTDGFAMGGFMIYPYAVTRVIAPSRKIWISDSPIPQFLNTAESRWSADSDGNAPYQGFTRHSRGGNALFHDGHVEWLPLTTFTEPADSTLGKMIELYFNPARDPNP